MGVGVEVARAKWPCELTASRTAAKWVRRKDPCVSDRIECRIKGDAVPLVVCVYLNTVETEISHRSVTKGRQCPEFAVSHDLATFCPDQERWGVSRHIGIGMPTKYPWPCTGGLATLNVLEESL